MLEPMRVQPLIATSTPASQVSEEGPRQYPRSEEQFLRLRLPFGALAVASSAVDSLMILAAALVGGIGYQIFVSATWSFDRASQFLAAGLIAAVLFGFGAHSNGLYQLNAILSIGKARRRVFSNWMFVSLVLSMIAFLLKVGADFSRGSIICFAALALVFLLIGRLLLRRIVVAAIENNKIEGRRVVLVGARDELAPLDLSTLLQCYGVTEVGRLQVSGLGNGLALPPSTQKILDEALALGRQENACEIVLALPWSESRQIELFREALRSSPLPVRLLPDRRIRNITSNPSFTLGRSLSIEVQRAPLNQFEQFTKRALDIVGASIGLLLLAPIMIVAAVAIKLDSDGPVLFRQRRNGFNTREFMIFKFRSMSVMEDGCNIRQATRSDPRVTAVGRILRQSSIDELPQLFNVLKGDMSLVGPRPHALAHDSHYGAIVSEYAFRHHVKPGITGWAQVNGYRGETARIEQMKQRVSFDLAYINNWSLLLDLAILGRTCFELVRRKNAY